MTCPCIRPRPLTQPVERIRLITDTHIGSAAFDEALLKRDLAEALTGGERVLLGGDILDAIAPGDKRYEASMLHPRVAGEPKRVIARAMDWAVELFAPVAEAGLIDAVGAGNHEEEFRRSHGWDLTAILVSRLDKLRRKESHPIADMGISAFLRYEFPNPSDSVNLWFHHGASSAATPHGALGKLLEMAECFRDWDVAWMGHTHQRATSTSATYGPDGTMHQRHCILTPSYLRCWEPGLKTTNYAVSAGYGPAALGSTVLEVRTSGGERELRIIQ